MENLKKEEDLERNKYSAIIIGTGGQGALADTKGSGNEHKTISFAKAITEHEGLELYGFIDNDFSKATKAQEIWNASYASDELSKFDLSQVDIAIVATSDDEHYEILKQIAEHPPKLVICEKPLCKDLEQAREIVELYRQREIPLLINYTRRFIPRLQELKRRYKNGEFGKIVSANIVFNRDWVHSASHAIDFCEWMFDGEYNGKILECETDYRIWQIDLYFERYHWREERIGNMSVPSYFDNSMQYVVENAYNFLEGKEELKCTATHALKALEICYELMEE